MGTHPVGNVGQSWHALPAHEPSDSPSADAQGGSHGTDAATAGAQGGSAHITDHSKPTTDDTPNSQTGQGGFAHTFDHSKSSDANGSTDTGSSAGSGPKADGQGNGDGRIHGDQQGNGTAGTPDNVTLKPQGNGDQPSSGPKTDTGKFDGKNTGWGDGDGGGQNKGIGNEGNSAGGMHDEGQGLLGTVGNTLDSLLSRSSSLTANNSYTLQNLSFTNAYSASDSSQHGMGGSASEGLLSSVNDAVGGALHDVGEAAASLLDGRSGNRVDPSDLTDRSFNDWAGNKANANADGPFRASAQAGRNATDNPLASQSSVSAPGHFADPAESNIRSGNQEQAARSAAEDEETSTTMQTEDRPASASSVRTANAQEEDARFVLTSEEPEAHASPGSDALGRNAYAAVADGKPIEAIKQIAGQSEEDGPDWVTLQPRPAQGQTGNGRDGVPAEDALADTAVLLRPGLAARSDLADARNPNSVENAQRQTVNEQTQYPPAQNANYVGEGRQTAPDPNPPLVATVERVGSIAANLNIEQDEMKQEEHLDTQEILLRQFTPALVGISALISSAIGGTTMLVSPGGSAAPLLLGASAILFALGAWRGANGMRTQMTQEKSWAEMLASPTARGSLIATGANSLGLVGSAGLSLLALI
jgi:hypothetical protein